jgi:hypothetical protein
MSDPTWVWSMLLEPFLGGDIIAFAIVDSSPTMTF